MKIRSFTKCTLLLLTCVGIAVSCSPPKTQNNTALTAEFIDQNLQAAVEQYKVLMENVPADKLPRTYDVESDKMVTSGPGWWTSGFYPGTLLYLYEYSKDSLLLDTAKSKLALIESQKNNKGTHDLGFMIYCSFGNAYRLLGDEHYKAVILTASESLSTRYNDTVGCIQSWDHGKWAFPVIIDNMMNLEMLAWATQQSGDQKFLDIAKTHANTTMENHFRNDYSSYHVIDYDPVTGKVKAKNTAQGAADSSAWSRGQAWGLYGYTMMYRETKDKAYLEQAKHIADFILDNPNMPEDMVPYWDFDAPNLPDSSKYGDKKTIRDVSAAAINASALLELSTFVEGELSDKYKNAAEKTLSSLSKAPYKAEIGTNGGFILKHSTGSIPHGSEVDVPLTYADYYYVEALLRYRDMLNKKG